MNFIDLLTSYTLITAFFLWSACCLKHSNQLLIYMKTILKSAAILLAVSGTFSACTNDARFEDLSTGKKIYVIQNENGEAVDSLTNEPVEFYVDLETKDTIYGKTGRVVNNAIIKTPEGTYELDETKIIAEEDEMKIKSEDTKIKIDGDEMKIKTDDKKIKIDGDERKVKYDN